MKSNNQIHIYDKNLKHCRRCFIILSNQRKCRCGIKHGAFYLKHPDHCKDCWDAKKKAKNI